MRPQAAAIFADVLTDWVMIRRAAFELEDRFRGARVFDVGLLSDGRIAVALSSRREPFLICLDIFGSPPLVTVECGELPIVVEPGFIRAAGAALRGTALLAVKGRKGDRLMRFTFGTRSKFGVGDAIELYVELVPRFGNVVLVKHGSVVAAAKEFSLAQNGTRAVETGMSYQPPTGPPRPALYADVEPSRFETDEFMRAPVFVYRQAGAISAIYPHALEGRDGDEVSTVASILDALRSFHNEKAGTGARARTAGRRKALLKRLDYRAAKFRNELASIESTLRKAQARETLRERGDEIYASLYEIDDEMRREEAKENAVALFAEYKKLGSAIPHLEQRAAVLRESERAIEELRWETERAADEDLDDVAEAITVLEPNAQRRPVHARRGKRKPLEYRTAGGSRILIGRSPSENADLTFKIARPNDLWFHAQNIPGAHVILQRDDRDEPPSGDIERAASFAAAFSKGKGSSKIPIDYTLRKYVRAARNAPPGLVWYTHARTIMAAPQAAPLQS